MLREGIGRENGSAQILEAGPQVQMLPPPPTGSTALGK